MKQKCIYLVLAVIGFVGPYYFFASFLAAHGLDGKTFVQELLGTKISTFFAADLLVSSVVFVIYLRQEAIRYLVMVSEVAGPRWLDADHFRFGASSLLNDLLLQRHKLARGTYDGPDYVTLD